MEQLGTVSGKRTIVLISDGFTIQPGRDLFELIAIYLRDPEIALQDPIARMDPEMDAVLRLADDRNVVFYTLDSRGVYVVPPGGYDVTGPPMSSKTAPIVMPEIQSQKTASAVEKDDGLRELAEATGGLFFGNTNNALNGMRHALADGREYYVLAYNSTNQTSDRKYRAIKVQVKGKNLMVRAKSGYWAPAGNNAMATATTHAEPGGMAPPVPRQEIFRRLPPRHTPNQETWPRQRRQEIFRRLLLRRTPIQETWPRQRRQEIFRRVLPPRTPNCGVWLCLTTKPSVG